MQEVVGSNSWVVYWIDIFSHLFVVKIYCWFEKNEKEAGVDPFFKKTIKQYQIVLHLVIVFIIRLCLVECSI